MATGFGCMIVGPAGSGKVSDKTCLWESLADNHLHFCLVNHDLRLAVSCWSIGPHTQGMQSWPSCGSVQVQVRHRYPWSDFSRRCTRARELRTKRRTSLLPRAPSWERWLAHRRASRVCRGQLRHLWLSWLSGTLLAPRRHVETGRRNHKDRLPSLCSILLWRDISERANEVYRHKSHLNINDDVHGPASRQRSD